MKKADNKILCRRCQTELGREDATLFAKLKCPQCGLVVTWRPSVPREESRLSPAQAGV